MTLDFLNINNMYGMNNFSGMLGSCLNSSMLFNPIGSSIWGFQSPFVNCDGTYNYQKAYTANLISQGVQFVGGLIGLGIAERKANSVGTLDSNLEYVNSEIQKGLEDIGNGVEPALTEKTYTNHKATSEPWYTTKQTEQNKVIKEHEATLKETGKSADISKTITSLTAELGTLKAELEDLEKGTSEYIAKQNDIIIKQKEIEAQQDKLAKAKVAEAGIKTATTILEELDLKAEARQEKINLGIKAVGKLIEERAKIEKNLDGAVLDKADGNWFTRTSDAGMEKLYNENGTGWKNGAEVDKNDVQNVINHFMQQGNIKERQKWAQLLVDLKNNTTNNISVEMTPTQQRAVEIAEEWLKANPVTES